MIASYRDPRYAASLRIQHLREAAPDMADDVPGEMARIHARRVARTAAGAAAIAGFIGLALAALVQGTAFNGGRSSLHATHVLIGAILLSIATYVIARAVAAATFERRVRSSFDVPDDELARVAHLESDDLRRAAARLAGAGEKASIAVPMAGAALLGPLSIHLLVWCVSNNGAIGSRGWLEGFDVWIIASLLLVGIAHLVLALLCLRFADRIGAASLAQLRAGSPMSGWAALGWTVLASCVPGIVAFAIPPFVVLATGILFIPWMFRSMHVRAIAERIALDIR